MVRRLFRARIRMSEDFPETQRRIVRTVREL
jgi:hypothetical protein